MAAISNSLKTNSIPISQAIASPQVVNSPAIDLSLIASNIANQLVSTYKVPGCQVLIVKGGKRYSVFQGINSTESKIPISENTAFGIGSVTKTLTASLILKLVDQGKLNLQSKLIDLIPEVKSLRIPHINEITLEEILSHTSGLADYRIADEKFNQVEKSTTALTRSRGYQFLKCIENKEPSGIPGIEFQYSNTNYLLAGMIIERITQKSLSTAFKEYIFNPIKMNHSSLGIQNNNPNNIANGHIVHNGKVESNSVEPSISHELADGGILSTSSDLLKFQEALFNGNFLSQKSLKLMLDQGTNNYGLGISKGNYGKLGQIYFHEGETANGYKSIILYFPRERTYVTCLVNGSHTSQKTLDFAELFEQQKLFQALGA